MSNFYKILLISFQLKKNIKMNKHLLVFAILGSLITLMSGCEIIGGIFKTGMGVGIFLVVIVIAIIFYFVNRMGKNKE